MLFAIVFALTSLLTLTSVPFGNAGVFMYRGYAFICTAHEGDTRPNCHEEATRQVFYTHDQCAEEVVAYLERLRDAYDVQTPRVFMRAQWVCEEDHDVYTT